MTTVTGNNTAICEYCERPFTRLRRHGRFCSVKCRVYASRHGTSIRPPSGLPCSEEQSDESIGAAILAAHAFTPIVVPDTKAAAAIQIERPDPAPNKWIITVPSASSVVAGEIHQQLVQRIDDLCSFANVLGAEIRQPRQQRRTGAALTPRTRGRRKKAT
jgi:hypothetical protein